MAQPLTSVKPPALHPGDAVRILSLSSPVQQDRLQQGCAELARLGYSPQLDRAALACDGFFAGSVHSRREALKEALSESSTRAIVCSRGGYGANYLLEGLEIDADKPKILVGYSDVTLLHIFLWQEFRWVAFYGPMIASGFDCGANAPGGYDLKSLTAALNRAPNGYSVDLLADPLVPGAAEGILSGGCLTLVETSLSTPWELDTSGSLLILEDRGMKPWQVDRALMHLKQAGKFDRIAGLVLGDFPECEGPAGSETVRDVARRILSPLGIPVVWGAPIGHTKRPLLTLPLGVRAQLSASSGPVPATCLEVLESAVS